MEKDLYDDKALKTQIMLNQTPFSPTCFCISVREKMEEVHSVRVAYWTDEVKDTWPWESELHNVKKKNPDKEVIHSQPVEEVAMDTAGAERSTCTEAGEQKASGGKQVDEEKRAEVRRRRGVGGGTYAISVCLPVHGGPALRVCWGGAAPAVGCRVGGSSGNDHVIGQVRRVLREVITWQKHPRNEGGSAPVAPALWKDLQSARTQWVSVPL